MPFDPFHALMVLSQVQSTQKMGRMRLDLRAHAEMTVAVLGRESESNAGVSLLEDAGSMVLTEVRLG